MFRIWIRKIKDNRLINDITVSDGSEDSRTHKVLRALEKACCEFDLPGPIWLDSTIRDFQRFARCRFGSDCFIEETDFDYLELRVIEED